MDIFSSATASFDAGHRIPALARCSKAHGHQWTVRSTVKGELDPATGYVRNAADLVSDLEALVVELHGQDLDEMLPGVVPSPLGLAAYFIDRLGLRYPGVVSISVECSDGTRGDIQRTPRQL